MASISGENPRWRGGLLRMLVESAALLTISVCLFRTFAAQGYMIETGSMAPGLWGYHRRAVCPSCQRPFSVGESRSSRSVACPNCGQSGIDTEALRRNDGDQLLVARAAFDVQAPRRWGVVVFRNPSNPNQAYVKRVAGLPGETLQIVRGDVHVNGRVQPKPLAVQRSMRILVYDHNFPPDDHDPNWRPRWVAEDPRSGWESHGTQFGFDGVTAGSTEKDGVQLTSLSENSTTAAPALHEMPESAADDGLAYVHYRHWIRHGGGHRTSVRVRNWPENIPRPEPTADDLEYDESRRLLICRGALPADRRDELAAKAPKAFQQAIEELFEGSHIAPIVDAYGYNGADLESGRREVHDLALALRLTVLEGDGEFAIGLHDGTKAYECRLDFAASELQIFDGKSKQTVRRLPLPGTWPGENEIDLSLMDQQLGLAVNGRDVFTWDCPDSEEPGGTAWRPAWFGARKLRARVEDIRLYRDVHYIAAGRGVREPIRLAGNEYFVLGDNSPISRDSRSWTPGQVLTTELLLGKPFLVHLPSVRRSVQLGSWRSEIRIPDLSRIRYIR